MIIDFDNETKEIISDLKLADGYLDCEKVIIYNIKKHLANGFPVSVIEGYLKKLMQYFEDLIVTNKNSADCTNYRYAVGFVNTLISTPYWHSWIKTTIL